MGFCLGAAGVGDDEDDDDDGDGNEYDGGGFHSVASWRFGVGRERVVSAPGRRLAATEVAAFRRLLQVAQGRYGVPKVRGDRQYPRLQIALATRAYDGVAVNVRGSGDVLA